MKVQPINAQKFCGRVLQQTGANVNKHLTNLPKTKTSLKSFNVLDRAVLQKSSELNPLGYDYDFDFSECGNDHRNLEEDAKNVVVGMTMVNAFNGFSMAQLFGSSAGVSAGVISIMATKIASIYGVKLSDALFTALKEGLKGFVYSSFGGAVVGMIPVIGNFVNGATQALITKSMGYHLIDLFEQANARVARNDEIKKILDENEKLKKRNELMNKALEEIIEEERKKKNG